MMLDIFAALMTGISVGMLFDLLFAISLWREDKHTNKRRKPPQR
jgi:hypothetical protein